MASTAMGETAGAVSLAALAELNAVLASCGSVDRLAQALSDGIKWVLPVERVSLVLFDPPAGASPAGAAWDAGIRYPGAVPIPGRPAPAEVGWPADITLAPDAAMRLFGDAGVAAARLVPLGSTARPTGVAGFAVGTPDRLAALDRGLCSVVALVVGSLVRRLAAEAAERSARERAEAATAARDRLIAAIAHDLRNPLMVAQGLLSLVMETGGSTGSRAGHWVAQAHGATDQMVLLIDELVDSARIENGHQLALQRTRSDLGALVHRAVSPTAALRGQRLSVTLPGVSLPCELDERRVARVVYNLVSNAFKFNRPDGRVWVSVAPEAQDVVVRVRDEGIGIPADDLPRLFARYYRASNATAVSGTGLGLSVSKEIIVAHGGRLDVESVAGEGTTFTLALPHAA
ncbi:MAG: sensor histidine kinase [Vicinamibacterales bacterium]